MFNIFIGKTLQSINKGESGEVARLDESFSPSQTVSATSKAARVDADKYVYLLERKDGTFCVAPWEC